MNEVYDACVFDVPLHVQNGIDLWHGQVFVLFLEMEVTLDI